MTGRGSLIAVAALALLFCTGLTAAVPGAGPQTVGAQDQSRGASADRFLRVEFAVEPYSDGRVRITGYVYNDNGRAAGDVRLRISELDSSGYAMTSYVERLLETVPALGRAYFDVKVPDDGASYRVVVDSWNLVQSGPN